MKKIFLIASAIAFSICGYSQIYTPVNPTVYGKHELRVKSDSAQHIPEKDSLYRNTLDTTCQLFYNKKDSSVWAYNNDRGFWKIDAHSGVTISWGDIVGGSISDQTDLQDSLNLKLNISDTSLMLSLYFREVGYGLLTTGSVPRFDSATVFPQLRATIPTNTDSLFGVQDNLMAANRTVNMNGKVFRWTDAADFPNYFEYGIGDNGYLEYNIQNAAGTLSTFQSASSGASSSTWAASSTNIYGTQYFSVRSSPTFHRGQFGNDWNQSGQWVDFLQQQLNDGTNGGSSWFQHREKWTGVANFTSGEFRLDSNGASLRTKKTVGADKVGYKGILVDSNSNFVLENYPASRNDGVTQKVLYQGNSNGDVKYGYLDTSFYATQFDILGLVPISYPYTTLKYYTGYGTFGNFQDSAHAAFSAGINILISSGQISADTTTGGTKIATQGDITRALSASTPTLTQYYVGVGNGSNLLSGSVDLQFQSGALSVNNSSGNDGVLAFGYTTQKEFVSVSTPASGYGTIYAKNDGTIHYKNSAGTDYDLTSGGSGTVTSVSAGFGTNFTTITSTGSVIVDTTSIGVTSWVRTKKVVDSLGALIGGGSTNIYNTDGTLTANRTLDGSNGTYSLSINEIPSFQIRIDSSTSSTGYALAFANKFENNWAIGTRERTGSGTEAAWFRSNWNSGNIWSAIGASHVNTVNAEVQFRVYADSAVILLPNSQVFKIRDLASGTGTKALRIDPSTGTVTYADTTSGGGSGTINSGTTGKPAYYVGSTTLDDFAAVDYATSGNNVTITQQNTTDVNLLLQQIGSSSADAFRVKNSGTTTIANITKDGYGNFGRVGIGTFSPGVSLDIQDAGTGVVSFQISDPGGGQYRLKIREYGTIFEGYSSVLQFYNAYANGILNFGAGNVGDEIQLRGDNGISLKETSAPATPSANRAVVYVKSDGLFYGKDDAGVETMLSNSGGSGLTIGTTAITSGTNTRILYNNSGVVGEYTISGTGTVVAMATATTLTSSFADVAFSPSGNDGATLGSTSLKWSDLFLASGAVINFNSGDVTLIHTSGALTSSVPLSVTTGSSTYRVGGSLKVNVTDVGNVGAGEDDLMTYSIAANTLGVNGDYIEFTMTFDFASNANSKQVKVKYGGTTIYDSGAQTQNDGVIEITGKIVRTGAATQRITYSVSSNTTLFTDYADYVTAAETLSGAVTLKATGTAVSDNDIVEHISTIKFFPNN